MTAVMRQARHDRLRLATRLEIAGLIGKADDAVGVGDIDPLRIVAVREEGDAERLPQSRSEDLIGRGFAAFAGAQYADGARARLRGEDIAVRRNAHDARGAQ